MIEMIVCGAGGRFGSGIINSALADNNKFKVVGAIEGEGSPALGKTITDDLTITSDLAAVLKPGAVVIHFSTPVATMAHLEIMKDVECAAVVGTTGYTEEQQARIKYIGEIIPVIQTHNYGVGMNIFYALVKQATYYLKERFDIDIVEFHGAEKRDSPSGTAGTIAGKIAAVKGVDIEKAAVYSRDRVADKVRGRDEIGISSVRAGTYKSDHTIIFSGKGERIEMTHREEDPCIIFEGVMLAIEFIADKAPGYYGMESVLGLQE